MALQFVTRQLADSIITTAKLAATSVTAAKADLTGSWDFSSGTLKAALPTVNSDVATKQYVDNALLGIKWKQPARVVATGNIDISSGLLAGTTIDGVTLGANNRVLLVGQSTASENGVYSVGAAVPAARVFDLDTGTEFPSAAIFVSEGTANADTGWVCTNDTSPTIGTTAITFVQFTSLGQINAGNGLTKTGNTLDVNVGNGIQITSDAVAVKLASNKGLSVDANGVAVSLAANKGLSVDANGLAVQVKANSGIIVDSNGVSVSLEANKGLEFSGTGGLQVKTANGVQVDGSGFVSIKLDGATLATSGTGVKVATGGVGTTELAANSVTLAKAGFRPYAESFTGGTALAYDLGQDIRSEFYPGVLVAFNGQLLRNVASNAGDGEFIVDRNSSTSKTRITLGGTAPSASDTITANYLG